MDFILKHKHYFNIKEIYNKKSKYNVPKYRIKSKIKPLIDYIEELFISKGKNDKEINQLKEQFSKNKNKLTGILNRKRFRQIINPEIGFIYTEQIIDLVSIISGIALASHDLRKDFKKISNKDRKKISDNILKESEETFLNSQSKLKKQITSDIDFIELQILGEEFFSFKHEFLKNLSSITPIGEHTKYLMIATYTTAEKITEWKLNPP